jgi:hypothetical protein
MKIRELGAQMFYVGGLTAMTKLQSLFAILRMRLNTLVKYLFPASKAVCLVTLDSGTFKTNYQLTINHITRTEAARSPTVPVSTTQHDFCNIQLNIITGQLQLVIE